MGSLFEIIGCALCAIAFVSVFNQMYLSSKTKLQ